MFQARMLTEIEGAKLKKAGRQTSRPANEQQPEHIFPYWWDGVHEQIFTVWERWSQHERATHNEQGNRNAFLNWQVEPFLRDNGDMIKCTIVSIMNGWQRYYSPKNWDSKERNRKQKRGEMDGWEMCGRKFEIFLVTHRTIYHKREIWK